MSENIYTPPQSELVEESNASIALASRWKRLWASILDSLVIALITVPFMYFTGGFDGAADGVQPSLEYSLLVGVIGMVVFLLINAKLLIKNGQTIGKKILGIKIADLNGNLPTIKKHLLKRYAAYFLPAQIPIAGPFISIINILFIFGKQKRCIHDYIAGTKVIVN